MRLPFVRAISRNGCPARPARRRVHCPHHRVGPRERRLCAPPGDRPSTAAYGLNDSPAGLAAWIIEKFREWSDCDGDVYRLFTRDELLTNVTLYWMTQTIHSSFRIYQENRKAPLQFARGDFINPPCAVALFPKEIPQPPR